MLEKFDGNNRLVIKHYLMLDDIPVNEPKCISCYVKIKYNKEKNYGNIFMTVFTILIQFRSYVRLHNRVQLPLEYFSWREWKSNIL